ESLRAAESVGHLPRRRVSLPSISGTPKQQRQAHSTEAAQEPRGWQSQRSRADGKVDGQLGLRMVPPLRSDGDALALGYERVRQVDADRTVVSVVKPEMMRAVGEMRQVRACPQLDRPVTSAE